MINRNHQYNQKRKTLLRLSLLYSQPKFINRFKNGKPPPDKEDKEDEYIYNPNNDMHSYTAHVKEDTKMYNTILDMKHKLKTNNSVGTTISFLIPDEETDKNDRLMYDFLEKEEEKEEDKEAFVLVNTVEDDTMFVMDE